MFSYVCTTSRLSTWIRYEWHLYGIPAASYNLFLTLCNSTCFFQATIFSTLVYMVLRLHVKKSILSTLVTTITRLVSSAGWYRCSRKVLLKSLWEQVHSCFIADFLTDLSYFSVESYRLITDDFKEKIWKILYFNFNKEIAVLEVWNMIIKQFIIILQVSRTYLIKYVRCWEKWQ